MSVELFFHDGVAFHQEGKLDLAESCYQRVVDNDPQHAGALHYLGLIAFQRGHFSAASEQIAMAIRVAESAGSSAPPEFYINLANALKRDGRFDGALMAYKTALISRPDHAIAWFNMGLLQRQIGDFTEAVKSLEVACLQPSSPPQAWVELGECHVALGDDRSALECFDRVLPILLSRSAASEMLSCGVRIGRTLVNLARYEAALKMLETLCKQQSEHPELLNILGCALSGVGRLSDAERCFSRALDLAPSDVGITDNLACVFKDSGRMEDAIGLYQQLLSKGLGVEVWSNYLFCLLYSDQYPPATVLAEHQRSSEAYLYLDRDAVVPHSFPREIRQPLRIGYLSGDMYNHPVAYFINGILQNHDLASVTVYIYSSGAIADQWTKRLKAHASRWCSVRSMSDAQLAERIRLDGIDVLIDLSGHTAENRLAALKTHPAKVQASYLGYPCSTGLKWIDWRIVDSVTDPPGSDPFSSERLYRLPRSYYAYSAPECTPEPNALPALKNGFLTFGVSSNLAKVTPTSLDIWASQLRFHRSARLFWRARAFADPVVRRNMMDSLRERGIESSRVKLDAWAAHRERWNFFRSVDVALDTYPYNQATNTCEALWMGVPTISVAGAVHRSRMGASILHDSGLADWVFSFDDYQLCPETFASKVAILLNPVFLSGLRQKLRGQMVESRLMDGVDAARSIESACQAMMSAWRDG